MNYLSNHSRYFSPKWQAYVTPYEKSFFFTNGISVSSLWELKQALLTLPEDVIMQHVREDENDLAVWVEFVVGDKELAQELRKYKHRWGFIVALERQMMRTLSLPEYLAARWLAKTDKPFTFLNGKQVSSLDELKDALLEISDEELAFHCERYPNDLAVWVRDIIGDYELAGLLEEAVYRTQMHRYIDDHIQMLHHATEC